MHTQGACRAAHTQGQRQVRCSRLRVRRCASPLAHAPSTASAAQLLPACAPAAQNDVHVHALFGRVGLDVCHAACCCLCAASCGPVLLTGLACLMPAGALLDDVEALLAGWEPALRPWWCGCQPRSSHGGADVRRCAGACCLPACAGQTEVALGVCATVECCCVEGVAARLWASSVSFGSRMPRSAKRWRAMPTRLVASHMRFDASLRRWCCVRRFKLVTRHGGRVM
jgi:hypothetical protein